jgi:hypothetical protein
MFFSIIQFLFEIIQILYFRRRYRKRAPVERKKTKIPIGIRHKTKKNFDDDETTFDKTVLFRTGLFEDEKRPPSFQFSIDDGGGFPTTGRPELFDEDEASRVRFPTAIGDGGGFPTTGRPELFDEDDDEQRKRSRLGRRTNFLRRRARRSSGRASAF